MGNADDSCEINEASKRFLTFWFLKRKSTMGETVRENNYGIYAIGI